jgi:predicted acyl esterase
MKKILLCLFLPVLFLCNVIAQPMIFDIPGTINRSALEPKNGTLDQITDFATVYQVPFRMSDGTLLMTDIALPILSDSFAYNVKLPELNIDFNITLLKKGTQLIIYDSINGQPNPNPYQLPMLMTRTPYNKRDMTLPAAYALLGYVGAQQDLRGRYASHGAYLPLYSDSWQKWAYHDYVHVLDITDPSDPRNGNNHQDGIDTWDFVQNNLYRWYDLDNDGVYETYDLAYNGSIGMFGASALAYNQIQAAAARKVNPNEPGIKALLPVVGPGEFYKSTGYPNATFREQLVTGWLRGQIVDTDDSVMDIDFTLDNDLHSSSDYNTADKFEASNFAIDHFSTVRYEGSPAGFYPNSIGRKDMDVSRAMLNEAGESDLHGTVNRYTNMDVPSYHVGGWWDIFVDGTIETWNLQRKYANPESGNRDLMKVVMGPWAHQTITSRTTGDLTYPESVIEFTKIDIADFGDNIDIASISQTELIAWFRYNLNVNGYNKTGDPKILIPAEKTWQRIGNQQFVKLPRADYKIKFTDLLNFLNAAEGLKALPIGIKLGPLIFNLTIDIPKLDEPIIEGFASGKLDSLPFYEFKDIPAGRFYVVGPVDDGVPENANAGNYWLALDTFPLLDHRITWSQFFLHTDGSIDFSVPTTDEGFMAYVHDPDNPVVTVGGANMITKTPQGDRSSQGQMKLSDPLFAPYTMDRPGVLHFKTEVLTDTLSIVGFPKARIWAKSNPGNEISGLTNTEFFVRIVDVYPNGDEYFVVEGSVGSIGREYARSIAEYREDDEAPFSNIEIGKIYEYYFDLLPIAYTFGKGHRIKVLISSSNHARYQSCPNLPLMPGEFFRRQPRDGKTYMFEGREMSPRIAVNRLAISDIHPSQLIFPVYGSTSLITPVRDNIVKDNIKFDIYPNPAKDYVKIFAGKAGKYEAVLINALGQRLSSYKFDDMVNININNLPAGQYFVEITNLNNREERTTKKISKL